MTTLYDVLKAIEALRLEIRELDARVVAYRTELARNFEGLDNAVIRPRFSRMALRWKPVEK